jgi:hypothetical protein
MHERMENLNKHRITRFQLIVPNKLYREMMKSRDEYGNDNNNFHDLEKGLPKFKSILTNAVRDRAMLNMEQQNAESSNN